MASKRRSKVMIKNATITSKKNHVVQKSITIIAWVFLNFLVPK